MTDIQKLKKKILEELGGGKRHSPTLTDNRTMYKFFRKWLKNPEKVEKEIYNKPNMTAVEDWFTDSYWGDTQEHKYKSVEKCIKKLKKELTITEYKLKKKRFLSQNQIINKNMKIVCTKVNPWEPKCTNFHNHP